MKLLEAIMHDLDSVKDRLNVICEALLAAADANIEFPTFYEACLEHLSRNLSEMDIQHSDSPLSAMEARYFPPHTINVLLQTLVATQRNHKRMVPFCYGLPKRPSF